MLSTTQIRQEFLNFFKEKHEHTIEKSSSLIPDNPTVLLTTAGMLQFVPIFLGYEKAPYSPPRATTCQKCARAGGKDSDIENVGKTPRHHTFFEMLGNFSFGDYFKAEIIPWSWDFVTNYLKLDKDKLYVTIFEDDDEAGEIWKTVGIEPSRITKKGKKDNFWGPPGATGPCGPCSEIHYDLGEHLKCSDDCSVDTCECDRWVEIWNLVFMQYFQDEDGHLTPLEKKNVDTGMGLERIAMVVQGKESTFETDLLQNILDKVSQLTGVKYKQDVKTDVSLRIITDHARCVSFMISDGILPSNEGRGYVLRMILRRALRHGKRLGLALPFMKSIVQVVIDSYKSAYPELEAKSSKIIDTITKEEERFNKTLDRGFAILEDEIKKSDKILSAEVAFKMHDTFGFPLELTMEIAQENSLDVDVDGFKALMLEQKERARAAVQKIALTDDLIYSKQPNTEFLGYIESECAANVLCIIKDGQELQSAEDGEIVDVIVDKTVFYAESGGQVGDVGQIKGLGEVLNTFKVGKVFVHRVVLEGEINVGDKVELKINGDRRAKITAHHTLAHLLQAALLNVVGDEVAQAGSQVEPSRCRFDFSFSRGLTQLELEKVEKLINDWVGQNIEVKTQVMNVEEAKKAGAIALFGEKYEDDVRVVSVEGVSKELCGGCHAKASGEIRVAKIISEGAIAAGVRRIEAICTNSAIELLNSKSKLVDEIAAKFKIPMGEISPRLEKLVDENKSLQKELEELKAQQAKDKFSSFVSKAVEIEGGKLFISKVDDFDANALKVGAEILEQKLGNSVIVLVSGANIFAKVSDNFVQKGVQAGKIVSEIAKFTGGNGGGRPQFAQGGLKDLDKVDEILAKVESDLK